jgi:hypothetical protein
VLPHRPGYPRWPAVSANRGRELGRALVDYLRPWWPDVRAPRLGQNAPDALNTPGVVWENKTPRRFDPFTWARQAAGYIKSGAPDIPIVVYWPDGVGRQRPELALAIVPLPAMMDLLEQLGITPGSPLHDQLAARPGRAAAHPEGLPF